MATKKIKDNDEVVKTVIPENTEIPAKKTGYSFESKAKNMPNFSTTVKIGNERYEYQCINGKIETDNEILAEYLKKNNPFAVMEVTGNSIDPVFHEELKKQLQSLNKLLNEKDTEIEDLKKKIGELEIKTDEVKE